MRELDIPTSFIRIGLQINRHFPGYVDAYYGPPELRSTFEAEEIIPLEDLEVLTESLEESITTGLSLPVNRREYLMSELHAMRMIIRILRGDLPEIADEVYNLYGVKPHWVHESLFDDAHKALNEILPGTEPLSKRIADFRERSKISVEVATPIIQQVMDDLRRRTRSLFNLPPHEDCEHKFVRDKSWVAYNWFLGKARSHIEFNQDFPIWMTSLPYTVAHEAYPGHHTEHIIKEERLYRQDNRLEHSILLSNTPSALISEGIAMNALEAITSQEEITNMFVRCYKTAGLSHADAVRVQDFNKAARPLNKVSDNQVLLLYRDHAPVEEIIAYGIQHALSDEKLERQSLPFINDPLWRSYSFNYTLGRDLVSAFLNASQDKTNAFAQLLSEPIIPSQIHCSIIT